jgi:drug/metabolite transporter (DMT)-like permease
LHLFYSPLRFLRAAYTFQEWGWMIYVSVVGTLIPFGLFFLGVNQIRATRAAITATLEPIFAGMIAYLALGEALEGLQLLGGGLVVTAVVLLQARRERDDLTPAAIRERRGPGGSF